MVGITVLLTRTISTPRAANAPSASQPPLLPQSRLRKERLDDHLGLLRCYYNFIRPHRALKFGKDMLTPAIQVGLASERMTFRRHLHGRS